MDPQQFETIKTILRNFDQRLNLLEERQMEHDEKIISINNELESTKKPIKSPVKPPKKYVIEEPAVDQGHSQAPVPTTSQRKQRNGPKMKIEENIASPKQRLEYSKAQLQSIRNKVLPELVSEDKKLDLKTRAEFIRQFSSQNGSLGAVLSKSVVGLKDDVRSKGKMEKRSDKDKELPRHAMIKDSSKRLPPIKKEEDIDVSYYTSILSSPPMTDEEIISAIPAEAGVKRFYVIESADVRPQPTKSMSPMPSREPAQIHHDDDEFHFVDT